MNIEAECDIIIGGDFNAIINPELDGLGGKPKLKESVKIIDQIRSSFDLIVIWRVRNPDVKRFSWRQKNPVIQPRIDFWLISCSTQDDIESVDIILAIKSDHSAITFSGGSRPSAKEGARLTMNVEFCEDKFRHFKENALFPTK